MAAGPYSTVTIVLMGKGERVTRIGAVRRELLKDRSNASCLAICMGAIVVATLIRLAVGSVAPLTYVTYYPAVLICSLLTGWRAGLACALLSGVIAETLFSQTPAGDLRSLARFLLYVGSCAIIIATAQSLRHTVRELGAANRMADMLNRELQHRVRNILAVVQAIAKQSAKESSPRVFVEAFEARLQALASAHDLLSGKTLDICSLAELVDEACRPFSAGGNIVKSGPACTLPAESCVALVLALHELCTNAVKYGALSCPEGRVDISWSLPERGGSVTIGWQESGGPIVEPPSRKGLGTALLRPSSGIAAVELRYDRHGVFCAISVDGAEAIPA